MSEWKECKLGDIATLNYGKALKENVRICGNIPVFSSAGISGWHNSALVDSKGIIIGRKGTIGKVYKTEVPFFCIDTAYYVLPNENIYDFTYIYYALQNLGLEELNSDSAVPGLNREAAYNQELLLPPLPEQKAIASVLSSLDDKIDLLHRQNKTLEAMAEALFRQWFMEEGKTICAITDFVDFNPYRQLAKQSIAPYLEMSNVSTSVFHPENWYDREFSAGTKFKNGDTLLARITPCLENGKTTFVTFLAEKQIGWGSTEFIVMRSKENIVHPFFTYVLAKNDDFRGYAEGCLEGSSGRQRVNVDHLKNYELYAPEKNQINQFNEFSKSIVPKLDHNFKQIKILEKLRDTLLPKLMSGEVRVNVCTRFTGLRDGHD